MLEIFIQHSKEDVESAIVQFVARRSYRLTKPWYLEGLRIEAPQLDKDGYANRGFWAGMFDSPSTPRIDVEPKRRRSGARVRIVIANTPESTRLAYELHAYLLDERSYERTIPPICPRCSSPIANITARYCGRCGHKLVVAAGDPPARNEILPNLIPFAGNAAKPFAAPPVLIERDEPEIERSFERPIDSKTQDIEAEHSASEIHSDEPVTPVVTAAEAGSSSDSSEVAPQESENIDESQPNSESDAKGKSESLTEPESEAEGDDEAEKSPDSPVADDESPTIPERRNAIAEE
ncbi:MAG: hypothetical protein IPK83_17580 [Planctomycetes bacterium]|nr:hypothetical protein [Planctomycetota bacterium]